MTDVPQKSDFGEPSPSADHHLQQQWQPLNSSSIHFVESEKIKSTLPVNSTLNYFSRSNWPVNSSDVSTHIRDTNSIVMGPTSNSDTSLRSSKSDTKTSLSSISKMSHNHTAPSLSSASLPSSQIEFSQLIANIIEDSFQDSSQSKHPPNQESNPLEQDKPSNNDKSSNNTVTSTVQPTNSPKSGETDVQFEQSKDLPKLTLIPSNDTENEAAHHKLDTQSETTAIPILSTQQNQQAKPKKFPPSGRRSNSQVTTTPKADMFLQSKYLPVKSDGTGGVEPRNKSPLVPFEISKPPVAPPTSNKELPKKNDEGMELSQDHSTTTHRITRRGRKMKTFNLNDISLSDMMTLGSVTPGDCLVFMDHYAMINPSGALETEEEMFQTSMEWIPFVYRSEKKSFNMDEYIDNGPNINEIFLLPASSYCIPSDPAKTPLKPFKDILINYHKLVDKRSITQEHSKNSRKRLSSSIFDDRNNDPKGDTTKTDEFAFPRPTKKKKLARNDSSQDFIPSQMMEIDGLSLKDRTTKKTTTAVVVEDDDDIPITFGANNASTSSRIQPTTTATAISNTSSATTSPSAKKSILAKETLTANLNQHKSTLDEWLTAGAPSSSPKRSTSTKPTKIPDNNKKTVQAPIMQRNTSLIDMDKPHTSKAKASTIASKQNRTSTLYIVTSGLSKHQLLTLNATAEKFGAIVEKEISDQTTHLVIGTNDQNVASRTIKYLEAIVRQLFIVSIKWILESFGSGKFLDEMDFIVNGDKTFNGGPRKSIESRMLKDSSQNCDVSNQSKGKTKALSKWSKSSTNSDNKNNNQSTIPNQGNRIFEGLHVWLHGKFSNPGHPTPTDFVKFLELGGATVMCDQVSSGQKISMHQLEIATDSMMICDEDMPKEEAIQATKKYGFPAISSAWILDSISHYEKQDKKKYYFVVEEKDNTESFQSSMDVLTSSSVDL